MKGRPRSSWVAAGASFGFCLQSPGGPWRFFDGCEARTDCCRSPLGLLRDRARVRLTRIPSQRMGRQDMAGDG
jgi:hypothetical protein